MKKILNMKVVKVIGLIWLAVHIFSMIIYPAYHYSFDWGSIQNVWDRWQTLNAAMIALASSLIAFQITSYKEEKQRHRNFTAARTFLPEALSNLSAYCKSSAEVFKEAYSLIPDGAPGAPVTSGRITRSLAARPPALPEGYRKVFQECILQADEKVAEYLSYILMLLQVHHSRMLELDRNCGPSTTNLIIKQSIISYIYRLSEIRALINNCFYFARGLEKFDDKPMEWEDFKNALSNMDIWPDDYEDLQGFINRAIERKKGND